MKIKYLIVTLFIASLFTACSSKNIENKSALVNNETISQEIFNSKENWQPINKNSSLQDSINNKEVK
jgi:hypothetical protein